MQTSDRCSRGIARALRLRIPRWVLAIGANRSRIFHVTYKVFSLSMVFHVDNVNYVEYRELDRDVYKTERFNHETVLRVNDKRNANEA